MLTRSFRGVPPRAAWLSSLGIAALLLASGGIARGEEAPSRSGVGTQALSLPPSGGKIEAPGDQFALDLATGTARLSVPFQLPPSRGSASPRLSIAYSSQGGQGVAGAGWDLSVSAIARDTSRGTPRYKDPLPSEDLRPEGDRFQFNGADLVPLCVVRGKACSAAADETMPSWSEGWMYFRARIEGAFLRFFWSPNRRTWRVQEKSGTELVFGVPPENPLDAGALEANPKNAKEIARWALLRATDVDGNRALYRYTNVEGSLYLSDVHDTPPAARLGAPASEYANHTRLVYETRPDPLQSYRRGWTAGWTQRLVRVDVASKPFAGGPTSPREVVRRYHLAYEPGWHASLLSSVAVEGRCDTPALEAGESVPPTACPRLPPMRFGYAHTDAYALDGAKAKPDLPGYEGFDDRVQPVANVSPSYDLDTAAVELFDVDGDALPDVLATVPDAFDGRHGLFLNGSGAGGAFRPTTMNVVGGFGATARTLLLANTNVLPLDVDADGVVNLLHQPGPGQWAVYRAEAAGLGSWMWRGRVVPQAAGASPVLDLARDARSVRTADVNGDGLLDVVRTSGSSFQTFFGLGRYAGGDGRFGQMVSTATGVELSSTPVERCTPADASPALLSDSSIGLADMNGDGLPDLVRVRSGDVHYWPGQGNGYFGTALRDACLGEEYQQGKDVAMGASPAWTQGTFGSSVRLEDIDGDGLDDLVQLTNGAFGVWLNVDGRSWTKQHWVAGTPLTSGAERNLRFADVNGSGTRDLVFGAGGRYAFVDLAGGVRPGLLTRVENGLGAVRELSYVSSTEARFEAERNGEPWTSVMPIVTHVLARMVETDALPVAGRPANRTVTEYRYSDPVYDGRERIFRGFRQTRAHRWGDESSKGVWTRTEISLGTCVDETADAVADCEPEGRYRDNPREALRGMPRVEESYDDDGVALSTVHHTVRLRHLFRGLDGRAVRHAFGSATDTFLYDTAAFDGAASSTKLDDVELEQPSRALVREAAAVALRSTRGRAHLRSEQEVDRFGNTLRTAQRGCIEGCARADESIANVNAPVRLRDTSGWLWRVESSFVEGATSGVRNVRRFGFDTKGHVVVTRAELTGSLPLDAHHEDGQTVAPAPGSASQDGSVTVSAQDFDAVGQPTFLRGAENRCTRVDYDATYERFPVRETVHVGAIGADVGGQGSPASAAFASSRAGAGCGQTALVASAEYDAGLGVVRATTDLHGEKARSDYDGFGRLVALFKPHPYAVGELSPLASLRVSYDLPTDPQTRPYARMHARIHEGETLDDDRYRSVWSYVDGLGRTVAQLEEADPAAGDAGQWVVTGLTKYNAKGAPTHAFQPWFWNGNPEAFPLSAPPTTTFGRSAYDAFGRAVATYGYDGLLAATTQHHALSTDLRDRAQALGDHPELATTTVRDGHGRTVATLERRRVRATDGTTTLETLETRTDLFATGEPLRIIRSVLGGTAAPVVRWMRYDSLGRRVLNAEPNTSRGFAPDPSASLEGLRAWRYAYDDAGRIVGTSDARGCGTRSAYDAGGRILAEDYSPCTREQAPYSAPNLVTGEGAEVFYRYDVVDSDVAPGCAQDPSLMLGRISSITDRGSKTVQRPDGRGRLACVARKIARPEAPGTASSADARFADEWFTQQVTYDAADRAALETTGATMLLSADGESSVATTYSRRGTVKAVCSSYGQVRARTSVDEAACRRSGDRALVSAIVRAPNGRIESMALGDLAQTTTAMQYDVLERVTRVKTERAAAPTSWAKAGYPASTPTEPTQQLVLEDGAFAYDLASNPLAIDDLRDPSLWPEGAKPVSRTMRYDDRNRLEHVRYTYAAGDDRWTSPFAHENLASDVTSNPQIAFASRVREQSFVFDAFGNSSESDDDAHGFFDRSLGTQRHGSSNDGPDQLRGASNEKPGEARGRAGALSATYDDAGNLASLTVKRAGPCLPAGAGCGQFFAYTWDEAGRLVRARRWDTEKAVDTVAEEPAVELRYAYDGGGMRVLKTAVRGSDERHTVYALPGVELRNAHFEGGAYEHTAATEVPYLWAHGVRLARVHFSEASLPALASGSLHVLLDLPDHLGSSSLVLDQGTGEVVERTSFLPYGATENDYRPERWGAFREDYKFTGKEEDTEVGLQYFGFRYFAPALNRWVSPDPLAVHGLGADLNVYAYVHGRVFVAVDPLGLEERCLADCHSSQPTKSVLGDQPAMSREQAQQYLGGSPPGPAPLPSEAEQGAGQAAGRFGVTCPGDCHSSKSKGGWTGMGPAPTHAPSLGGRLLIGTVMALPGPGTLANGLLALQAGSEGRTGDALGHSLAMALTLAPLRGFGAPGEVGARGARGLWGGRAFDLSEAGGPIRKLSTDGVRVSTKGIDVVEQHLAGFGPDPANAAMVLRLRAIEAGVLDLEQVDLNFYTHELRESVRYRRLGVSSSSGTYEIWNNAHTATLADYGLVEGPGVLYHPTVVQ